MSVRKLLSPRLTRTGGSLLLDATLLRVVTDQLFGLSLFCGISPLTFVPIELLLQVHLSVGGPRQSTHGNLELPSARANSDGWSGTQPFENSKCAFGHRHLFGNRLRAEVFL